MARKLLEVENLALKSILTQETAKRLLMGETVDGFTYDGNSYFHSYEDKNEGLQIGREITTYDGEEYVLIDHRILTFNSAGGQISVVSTIFYKSDGNKEQINQLNFWGDDNEEWVHYDGFQWNGGISGTDTRDELEGFYMSLQGVEFFSEDTVLSEAIINSAQTPNVSLVN